MKVGVVTRGVFCEQAGPFYF